MSSIGDISNVRFTKPTDSASCHLQKRESSSAAMNQGAQQHARRPFELQDAITTKRKLSVSPGCDYKEISSYDFYQTKYPNYFEPQLNSTSIMSKQRLYEAHDNKHQRLQYELIDELQPYVRSLSPQYNQTFVAENKHYIATTDAPHIFLHEPEGRKELTSTPFPNESEYLHSSDSHSYTYYREDIDPCHLNSSPPALINDFSGGEDYEYCKYCDSVHSARGCQVLHQAESNSMSSHPIIAFSYVQLLETGLQIPCSVDDFPTHCFAFLNDPYKLSGTFDWGGSNTVYDLETNAWRPQIPASESPVQSEQLSFLDARNPQTPQQQLFAGSEQYILRTFKSQDYAYIYETQGPGPDILSLKSVCLSPKTIANRLLVDHCKNCSAKCCLANPKRDCQILYKGESCTACGHQGCLDFLDHLAEKGLPSERRGEDGLVDGLGRCEICGRQNCGDLIPPDCTRTCGNKPCAECDGIETGWDEGKEMVSGNCGHGDCVSCQLARDLPAQEIDWYKQVCAECGEMVECVPLKTKEQWEAFYFHDAEVKSDREFKKWVRRLARRMGHSISH